MMLLPGRPRTSLRHIRTSSRTSASVVPTLVTVFSMSSAFEIQLFKVNALLDATVAEGWPEGFRREFRLIWKLVRALSTR